MQIYKKAYLKMFNAVTDALNALQSGESDKAIELLIRAQQDAEEMYLSDGDDQSADAPMIIEFPR